MKKENSKKMGTKLIACLIVLLMISAYFPIISTIVMATVPEANQITETTNKQETENQVVSNQAEQATKTVEPTKTEPEAAVVEPKTETVKETTEKAVEPTKTEPQATVVEPKTEAVEQPTDKAVEPVKTETQAKTAEQPKANTVETKTVETQANTVEQPKTETQATVTEQPKANATEENLTSETAEKKEVTIPDAELKKYLLNSYDADGDKLITEDDMLKITSFYISSNYNIKNLTGLETAQNITYLSLGSNYQDISAVNKLKKIKGLSLSNNVQDTISKLTIMNNLETLDIYNSIEKELDYAYLGTLKNLKRLTISDTYRKSNIDINNLKNLTNLTSLSITSKVQIDNLASLQQLKALTSLSIHTGDKLQDIGFISNLTGLEILSLYDNMISNITPLRKLTKLSSVNLEKNPINTKESETAETLKLLRDKGTYISVLETNKTSNIEFKDARFKEMLIKSNGADLNKDNQISIEEMERLSYISLSSSSSVKDESLSIEEIAYATNVSSLYIYSKIDDLTPITKLEKLNRLSISGNSVNSNNLKVVAGITNLEYLSISVNENVNNLEIFSKLTKLKELDISNNSSYVNGKQKAFDLKGLDKLTNLTKVRIYGSVSNINLIKKLTKLETLETTDRLFKDNGEQLTDKELVEFLKSLKVKNIRFTGNGSIQINLGNIEVGTNQKLNLATIDNELVKLVFTKGSMFYSDNIKVSYYDNSINKTQHPITLDTSEIGEKYLSVSISSDKFSCSLSIRWNNYIKGDTSKEINIPDANLKKVLLENNDIDNDKKITEQDIINIKWLEGYNAGIESLEGLQYAKNLKDIELSGNYIKDISPILGISTLNYINLSNNLITDISAIKNAKWTEVYSIYFNNNFIDFKKNNANYNALQNIMKSIKNEYYNWENEFTKTINTQYSNINEIDNEVNLEENLKKRLIRLGIDTNKDGKITRREMYHANVTDNEEGMYSLNLSNADITNISGLEYLGFAYIDLSYNNIEDITPITKNKNVYELNLSYNNISNISGIENCYNLGYIDLSNNKIANIDSLSNLFNMKKDADWREVYIYLANNQISNIDCVKNWKNLSYLDLSGNKITNIKELKNYNFKLSDKMDEDSINQMAQYLTI